MQKILKLKGYWSLCTQVRHQMLCKHMCCQQCNKIPVIYYFSIFWRMTCNRNTEQVQTDSTGSQRDTDVQAENSKICVALDNYNFPNAAPKVWFKGNWWFLC